MLILIGSAAVMIGILLGILGIILKGCGKDETGAKIAYMGIACTVISMVILTICVVISRNFINPDTASSIVKMLF